MNMYTSSGQPEPVLTCASFCGPMPVRRRSRRSRWGTERRAGASSSGAQAPPSPSRFNMTPGGSICVRRSPSHWLARAFGGRHLEPRPWARARCRGRLVQRRRLWRLAWAHAAQCESAVGATHGPAHHDLEEAVRAPVSRAKWNRKRRRRRPSCSTRCSRLLRPRPSSQTSR